AESHHNRQRLYLRLHRFKKERMWHRVQGRIRLNVHAAEVPFLPGDVVRVHRLRLYPVRGFLNPGGFDFQHHMHRLGIHAVGGVSKLTRVRLLHRPQHAIPQRAMERWRRLIRAQVRQHLAPPLDGIFLAMILGQRGTLSPSVQQNFRASGTAHLLVVSGLHVGFVASAFLLGWQALFRTVRGCLPRTWPLHWRPTQLAIVLSLVSITLYCSLVGWKVPTTRAAVMVGSSLLALAFGRQRELPYALALAAALLWLVNPSTLFSVGFQLSFAAVACMLLVSSNRLSTASVLSSVRRWGQRGLIYLLVCLAAYLGTLPILASAFHTIPAYGLVGNLVLIPLAAILVPLGVLALGVMILSPGLATLAFLPVSLLLKLMSAMAQTVAILPNAQLHLAAPSTLMFLGYYGLIGSIGLAGARNRRVLAVGCCFLLLAATGLQYLETRPRQLQVTFLDVGSGDAIFIQAPGNHYLLIDGGGTYDGRFEIGARVIAPVLWNHYVRRLDFMAMTHPQANHARGLVGIMRLFPTRHLLTNGTPLTAHYLRELLDLSNRRNTQHHTALDGPRRWQWGELVLTVLSPPSMSEHDRLSWQPPTENDRSLVLRLQYGNVRILLTGDIQHATEQWLVRHRVDLRADILQIPHHGSKTSTSIDFIQRVRPRVGIISLGANNTYGHPHARVLDDLASQDVRIFRTDYHGAITITTDGEQYHVKPLRSGPVSRHMPRRSTR
ncbi:MAG: DNA internalization-related competence protein ComEC/Rec2, partial [Candidatus Tectomicrobia bacterium]